GTQGAGSRRSRRRAAAGRTAGASLAGEAPLCAHGSTATGHAGNRRRPAPYPAHATAAAGRRGQRQDVGGRPRAAAGGGGRRPGGASGAQRSFGGTARADAPVVV